MQADLFGPGGALARPPVRWIPGWCTQRDDALERWSKSLPWEQRSLNMRGQTIPMPRLECWLGPAGATYTYSGVTYHAEPLSKHPSLVRLLRNVEERTGAAFDAIFANLYRDGRDSIGWHRDDEPVLGHPTRSVIASVSLGARRRFLLREIANPSNVHEWELGDGDLLVMDAGCQARWEHSVRKTARPVGPRLVLTLRKLVAKGGGRG